MSVWIIEPRDTLIVRDGRPFSDFPGIRGHSHAFPFPSTTTGFARTRLGSLESGAFDTELIEPLLARSFRGPFLVELTSTGVIDNWCAPAPADATIHPYADETLRLCYVPRPLPDGVNSNLPEGLIPLRPLDRPDNLEKPQAEPRFWRWNTFEQWLVAPDTGRVDPSTLGPPAPQPEARTHVALGASYTGQEGALFQTEGLSFAAALQDGAARLALALDVGDGDPQPRHGIFPMGGERRLMSWRPAGSALPSIPSKTLDAVVGSRRLRLILLTPAHFASGWRPRWLLEERRGVRPHLEAMALGRPQVVSGWDFAMGRPKPTRRLAPAGSVLFLTLAAPEPDAIREWAQGIWLQAISDDAQDRRDGFGIAAVGAWPQLDSTETQQ